MVRVFLDTIGRFFAGGVSADFIHKSSSGESTRHVNVPLFNTNEHMSRSPGSADVTSGENTAASTRREVSMALNFGSRRSWSIVFLSCFVFSLKHFSEAKCYEIKK